MLQLRYWPIGIVVVLFGIVGTMSVVAFARAGRSPEAAAVQAKLDSVPMTIGAWKARTTTVPERQLVGAEAQAHLSREYSRDNPPTAVSVLVLFGRTGALGAHTPEVCYAGAGYKMASPKVKRPVSNAADFLTAKFETALDPPVTIQCTWGWGINGVWKGSENARVEFSDEPVVYKIYVNRIVPPTPGPVDKDPSDEFLTLFIRHLNDAIAAPSELAR